VSPAGSNVKLVANVSKKAQAQLAQDAERDREKGAKRDAARER
jgi:hypothetical protein